MLTLLIEEDMSLLVRCRPISIEELNPIPPNEGEHFDVFQNYEIQALQRDELKAFMQKRGIGSLVQWFERVHQFDKLRFSEVLKN